ncbi:hypothetical protein BZA05DRAFT_411639 [Tricharina praecox]|uniref:uncharacterized protein n=1 Tax=Tricharina praecox TaxID=43433 RepID=UPI00221F7C00|nr:uncharacterized protein BZA05DRAFT_411639 [Tricharina praecox]KAI5842847.1 hypothetical protein BZA05DRAFT_411639 [Tricharina praecox]
MASDVAQLPGSVPASPADTPEEIRDYQRIINLRNEIYMGRHSRFKPPSIVRSVAAATPAPLPAATSTSGQSSSKPTPVMTTKKSTIPAASNPAAIVTAVPSTAATNASATGQIEDVLLTKSDVLIRAETTLKRQRIEHEVRNQLEQKKYEARLGMEVKDGKAVAEVEDDVDLEAAMQKAGMWLKPVERPEDPSSINKLKGFFGDKGERDDRGNRDRGDGGEMARKSNDSPARWQEHVEDRFDSRRVTAAAGVEATREVPIEPPHSRIVETLRERERRPQPLPPVSKPQQSTSPLDPFQPSYSASNLARSPLASPQPRYSATSQVRSPAAPQPVRPANVARVESQDRIIELENAERLSPPPPAHTVQVPSKRARQPSPDPYPKQEPINAPPFPPRDEYARRMMSPEIVGALRPSSRESAHPGGPPYRMPPDVAAHGYYQHPSPYGQPPHRHPYEGYPYQDPYAYPPPPPDYRRPYAPQYAAPPSAPPYYAPRPAYEDYGRYGTKPPPSVRPPFPRRSASPSDPYARRRDSRSISPDVRGRRDIMGNNTPGPVNQRLPPAGSPSPKRARLMPDGVEQDIRGPGPVAMEYPYPPPPRDPRDPRDRVYYEAREPSFAPPAPHARYPEEPPFLMPRPESVMYRGEEDYRGYRKRDYSGSSQSRPPVPLGGSYPPPPEYARPLTRAAMAVLPDGLEYPPRAGVDYYGRSDGRASVRPGEGAYLPPPPPPRQPSVRPDVPEYYGDRVYSRAASVRPDLERERYSIPPPSMVPPPPGAGYSPYGGVGGYRYRD